MSTTLPAATVTPEQVDAVFGSHDEPMTVLEQRAAALLPAGSIVWEADATTVEFSFVGAAAETVLGYPVTRWLTEPTFWADVVLHADDRDESISFCVAETACDRDHAFAYRARAADGTIVVLRDIVRVVPATAERPKLLRGIMIPEQG